MTILHVITSLRTGGAERLVTDLALRHKAYGEDVSVLVFDGTWTPLRKELEQAGVPVHALGTGSLSMHLPLMLPKLELFLRKHSFDIVHTHNTPCQLLASMTSAKNLVTTEHNTANRRRNWPWYRPIDRKMYARYLHIVCVSEETRKALIEWLPELAGKTIVIPNGIPLERFRNAAPAEDLEKETGFKILMAAAFRAQKDQETLLRAMHLLPKDFKLYLAGGAEVKEDRARLQSCKELTRNLGLDDRVSFLGIRDNIPSLLAACDISVLSTHYEGFALSAIESMASGKPLIASDVSGLREVVSGAGLLFPEGDAEKLAEIIRHLGENPGEAKAVADRCRERAARYNIDETARQYLLVYNV